ncbi:MAG: hypothetical protein HLUCCA01_10915 [Bacteroidetes bacterium HLUCCA01]|nr:MAG: hypothetical protein HLUCCA01_10915 [Bacteroidetes bacterium HLUCCA01]
MNPLERLIYNTLKGNPALKMAVRDIYQAAFDLLPAKPTQSIHPVNVREGYFFGFHDHTPFSPDNTMLLAHRYDIPLRMPAAGEQAGIGIFTGDNWSDYRELAVTRAWNWHQGAKLQWVGSQPVCVYNDHEGGRNLARMLHVETGESTDLPEPVGTVSADGRYAAGYSFTRTERYMPGYGYPYPVAEPGLESPVTSASGVYMMDLSKQQVRQLLTVEDLAALHPDPSMDGASHFVSHALFSPSSRRFVFLHRWVKGDLRNRFSRMISLDVEGQNLHIFPTSGMVSHIGWKNDTQVLAYSSVDGVDGYYLFTDQSEDTARVGDGFFRADGHPSYSPVAPARIITDTYPDRSRRSALLLFDEATGEGKTLGRFRHPKAFTRANPHENWRCDLHPRWDRTGRVVCFDSVHTGRRALCTMKIE